MATTGILENACEPQSLGRGSPDFPKVSFHLEVTLNHPRTATFLKMTSDKQKALYKKMYDIIINRYGPGMCYKSTGAFEYCRSGQVHMHMSLFYCLPHKMVNIWGTIADMARLIHSMLPKKYSIFNEKCMDEKYFKYRVPSMCIQFNSLTEEKRIAEWETYIRKDQ
ncbi:putative replicase [Circoviridae sp.]|nr:putative replicase [Circoviridae sp.]